LSFNTSGIKVINFGGDCGKAVAYLSPLIATGSDNGVIKVWNLDTGKCLTTSGGNAPRILGLATNPHHQIVASSRDDGAIQLWDFNKITSSPLSPKISLQAHRGMASALAFSLDGQLIASTGSDRLIKIWDAFTGEQLQILAGHTDYVQQLLFIDDRTILSQSYDKTIRQWDVITGEWKIFFAMDLQYLIVLCRSPDGRSIAFGSDLPGLIILDLNTRQTSSYPAVGNRLRKLTFSHDGRYIIGITDDRILNLWEVNLNYRHTYWKIGNSTEQMLREPDATAAIPHPQFSQLLIVGSDNGRISIWDLHSQTCLDCIVGHQHQIIALSIVPHPDRLISCSLDGSIKVWGLQDTRLTAQLYSIDFGTPYQNLNISGVKGLNPSQTNTLVRLGSSYNVE
jgi:WD40 repeat protein